MLKVKMESDIHVYRFDDIAISPNFLELPKVWPDSLLRITVSFCGEFKPGSDERRKHKQNAIS